MDEIIKDFCEESNALLLEAEGYLETAEEGLDQKQNLELFAQRIDRIMGGAKSLAMTYNAKTLTGIGLISEFCKVLGYKSAQLEEEDFYQLVIAFLFDSLDSMQGLLKALNEGNKDQDMDYERLVDRLKWISEKFDSSLRATLKSKAPAEEVKELLKRLGFR